MAGSPLKIILIGKTGCGKSSTGNFILSKKVFKSKGGFTSTTKEITSAETTQDGTTIKVVDTPGLFDTEINVFETALKIQTSLKEVSPGPHAFLIVIDASRKYTEEEKRTQHIIQLTFGEKIFKHAIVIITHEDQFDSSEEILEQARRVQELQTLIDLCGGRLITLNSVNTDGNYKEGKLKNIMEEVKNISKNGKVCYTENITIYTDALKEQANKKTAIKDLTLDLIESVIRKHKIEADRRVNNAQMLGIAIGTVIGGAAVVGTVVGTVGAIGYGIVKGVRNNPQGAINIASGVLKLGLVIEKALENAHESNNQNLMPYNEPPNFNNLDWDLQLLNRHSS